uniref:Chemokine interleukin-8-like domain-containing protein n=1 Tax=Dromaius novaehollandiae TaxID=8790 RepID=A0A8C4J2N8_DRONO
MDSKFVVVTFVLSLVLTAVSELPVHNTHSKFTPPKAIQNVKLNRGGPHCKNVENATTPKDGRQVCLEPTVPWLWLTVTAISAK